MIRIVSVKWMCVLAAFTVTAGAGTALSAPPNVRFNAALGEVEQALDQVEVRVEANGQKIETEAANVELLRSRFRGGADEDAVRGELKLVMQSLDMIKDGILATNERLAEVFVTLEALAEIANSRKISNENIGRLEAAFLRFKDVQNANVEVKAAHAEAQQSADELEAEISTAQSPQGVADA